LALGFTLWTRATPGFAQPARDGYGFMHDGWGAGSMIFGGFAMIVFWAVTIALIVLLVRWLVGSEPLRRAERGAGKTPLEILKERFAKGEIDKNEYEERRKLLSE
jgi:putative membrane protein